MENYIFAKKTLNTRDKNVDRFVYNRDHLTEKKQFWQPRNVPQTKDILDTKLWARRNYMRHLDKAFGFKEKTDTHAIQPWPCTPRRKSCLTSADSVLDLPSFSNADLPELLDWGQNNILVASLGINYYKWSWDSQRITGRGCTWYDIQTCKFNPNGDKLALGMASSFIQTHDSESSKPIADKQCPCIFKTMACSITSLDWSPTGNGLIVGCSRGEVRAYTRDLQAISFLEKPFNSNEPIFCVRISPDARFAAITTLHSTYVITVFWPFLQPHRMYCFTGSVTTAICWHPWRSALLARGSVSQANEAKVSLCSLPKLQIEEKTLPGTYCLDTMLFSNKSGELALSIYNTERGLYYPKTSSSLVVLSDLSTMVDRWSDDGRTGLNRVRTMAYSPDGTKLATATLDEDLIIWNFLPESKNKTRPKKDLAAMAVYLDKISGVYQR